MNPPRNPKPQKPIGPFSFCPKHGSFFATCKCDWRKGKKKTENDVIEMDDDTPPSKVKSKDEDNE